MGAPPTEAATSGFKQTMAVDGWRTHSSCNREVRIWVPGWEVRLNGLSFPSVPRRAPAAPLKVEVKLKDSLLVAAETPPAQPH